MSRFNKQRAPQDLLAVASNLLTEAFHRGAAAERERLLQIVTAEPALAEKSNARMRRGSVKATLFDLLEEAGATGLNARCAVEMGKQRGIDLDRQTVAGLLSRLKRDGAVDHDGYRYRLPVKVTPR